MVFHNLVYILVAIPDSVFNRHARGFLTVGPVVEGLLGSTSTYHAAEKAYLADCAQSGSRSTVFAYVQGATYAALAMGPQIAGLLLRVINMDHGIAMFYISLVFDVAVFCYALLILPESVTPEMMHVARHPVRPSEAPLGEEGKTRERWLRRIREVRDRLVAPLTIFGPKRKPGGGWDLNMTMLVIAQFTHLLSVGVVQEKFLYAQHTFAWSVKQLGYYISLLWVLQAFHLLLLLPTILRFIKPKSSADAGTPGGRTRAISQDMKFDYRIAQASIFLDAMAYMLTIIAPGSSQILFVCFTSLPSFTAGVNPAIHSLAVSYLFANGENAKVGQMFGGMSMLQAISHTLQPLVFGVLYSDTVATYPKAIFALAAGLLISSSAMFTLLRTNGYGGWWTRFYMF
ncbi:hypothetical protein JB92DRAFT_2983667 [Gautieria morchelliformis]|nr:hypothetical protein JB92DRAFT_2983667 [Gautieria morchelliformis]